MSKEAMDLIWDHSTSSGSHRLCLLAIARLCPRRRKPFLTEATASQVGKLMGVKEQQARRLISQLLDQGEELKIYHKGGIGKGVANIYQIVLYPALQGLCYPALQDTLTGLPNREGAGTPSPRCLEDPPNLIRMEA